ncbi:E3 ubiquitin-protein ligase TRIM7-like isoform X1 [Podarcis muralis]
MAAGGLAEDLSRHQRGTWSFCEKHQEPQKLFCKNHKTAICVICDKAKEHKKHKVVPLDEAPEIYKDQLCSHEEILCQEREKVLAYGAAILKESQDELDQIDALAENLEAMRQAAFGGGEKQTRKRRFKGFLSPTPLHLSKSNLAALLLW